MCVTVGTADFGAQVVQRPCRDGDRGQVWSSSPIPFVKGSGFDHLRSALAPGSCLDTLGQFVKIFPCSGALSLNQAQLWELV
jgi:hypothetical protein